MTNDQFIQEIEKQTGLEFATQFGFIAGTEVPFANKRGLQSGSKINGFEVWRNVKDKNDSKVMNSEGIEKNLVNIVNFLKS